ncbi:hypothetical protein BV898_11724 [Hypsibius exemplaris]|uniref:HTH CENPB-type domain-containing protein n=1 Tax=Hypsibius exemplaris TaxID=2072580 RepID=A0A1W0WFU4_HYPEX|nr:hypothetical protein BV898_11724 [Hypsibius exemplaris]
MSDKKKRLSVSSVRYKFPKVTNESMLFKWAKQLNPESQTGKIRQIFDITKAAYDKAQSEHAIIHDSDLTKWARDAAASVNLSGFRVSKSWISKFKKINNIVDQKNYGIRHSENDGRQTRPLHSSGGFCGPRQRADFAL